MTLDKPYPAPFAAGVFLQAFLSPEPDAFERLPMNLTADEIRAMVLEVLG